MTTIETFDEAVKGAEEPQEEEPQEEEPQEQQEEEREPEPAAQEQPQEKEKEPKPKKKPAALEKVICPGGCGRWYTKHWLRMGKHVCERKPRRDARPFVVKTKQPREQDAKPREQDAKPREQKEKPQEPPSQEPVDPLLEACRIFQNIQREVRQAKRDKWTSQML